MGEDLGIPIIDMQNLYQQETVDVNSEMTQDMAGQFRDALHKVGFAYLVNHGIPQELIGNAFEESKSFFSLPPEVKSKYAKKKAVNVDDNIHGYGQVGFELLNLDSVQEYKETFDTCWRGNRWFPTEELPKFQSAIETMETACRTLTSKLLTLLTSSVQLEDPEFFNKCARALEDPNVASMTGLRSLCYPPIPADVGEEKVVRCAEHTDWGFLTLLFQDAVGGLEVKRTGGDDGEGKGKGEWVAADPMENAIIINTGDLLEVWTGGYFPATPHRILIPKNEDMRSRSRQSIGFFLQADDEVMIAPLSSPILTNQYDFKPVSGIENFMMKAKRHFGAQPKENENGVEVKEE